MPGLLKKRLVRELWADKEPPFRIKNPRKFVLSLNLIWRWKSKKSVSRNFVGSCSFCGQRTRPRCPWTTDVGFADNRCPRTIFYVRQNDVLYVDNYFCPSIFFFQLIKFKNSYMWTTWSNHSLLWLSMMLFLFFVTINMCSTQNLKVTNNKTLQWQNFWLKWPEST
jgi:hypothetical protein